MKESALLGILQKLNIRVEGRNPTPSKQRVWINFRCPLAPFSEKHKFTEDRHPSAGAVADEHGLASRWHCYACKQHGTVYDLAHTLGLRDRNPAIDYEKVCEEIIQLETHSLENVTWQQMAMMDTSLPDPLMEEMYDGLWEEIEDYPEAVRFMVKRGISRDTARKLSIKYDPDKQRVLFEVRSLEGELYGWSGRTIRPDGKPKVLDYEGLPKRHLVLGAHRWEKNKPIVLVEGLFAYAHLHEVGVEKLANIGAILGSEMTKEKIPTITRLGSQVYLLMDPDEAGDACIYGPIKYPKDYEENIEFYSQQELDRDKSRSAIELLKNQVPVFVPEYPEGVDDPDDLTFEQVSAMLEETDQITVERLPEYPIR